MLRKCQRDLLLEPKYHNSLCGTFIIFLSIVLSVAGYILAGCAVEKGKIYEKDGKFYGKTAGLFKAKWDDYYLRGLSYGEGRFWEDASADFLVAIQKRSEDQRRARTYGMHFIDYFPHRELGIAYFHLGKYEEAIQALETSLASVETARTKPGLIPFHRPSPYNFPLLYIEQTFFQSPSRERLAMTSSSPILFSMENHRGLNSLKRRFHLKKNFYSIMERML